MKTTKNIDRKGLNTIVRTAKSEVCNANKSPLYILHRLNKLADGKIKIEGIKADALKQLQDIVKRETDAKGFTFACLPQNYSKQICRLSKYNGKVTTNETIETYLGRYELKPVSLTENGLITAIKSYIEYRLLVVKDLNADKRPQAVYKSHKSLFEALKTGEICDAEFIELYGTIARAKTRKAC